MGKKSVIVPFSSVVFIFDSFFYFDLHTNDKEERLLYLYSNSFSGISNTVGRLQHSVDQLSGCGQGDH